MANAAVVGEHTMNFDNTTDNPVFFDNGTTVFGPLDINPSVPVPDVGASLIQDGIRNAPIGIGSSAPLDNQGNGHLHYTFNFSDNSTAVAFQADVGGASIYADGSSFAFKSMFFAAMSDHDVNVTGYQTGGGSFSNLISSSATNSTVDFLGLDARYGDVTLIEMWFDSTGRGAIGPIGGTATYDNIVISSPVPLPAAFYLFMSGLIGLLSFHKRDKYSL